MDVIARRGQIAERAGFPDILREKYRAAVVDLNGRPASGWKRKQRIAGYGGDVCGRGVIVERLVEDVNDPVIVRVELVAVRHAVSVGIIVEGIPG